jgi:hypothetical protein
MLDYLERVSRYEVKDASGAPLGQLFGALTTRDPSLTAVEWQGMQWRWWEYGGYVGVPVLLLALVGAWTTWRRTWPWVVGLVVFAGLSMGNEGPVWPLLRGLHAFEGLRVPSRAIVVVVLLAAGLAGVGVSFVLRHAVETLGFAPAAVPGLLALGLSALTVNVFAVTRPTLEEAFTASPHAPAPETLAPFRQGYGKKVFVTRPPYTDHYEHALRNEGMLNCHERLHLPIRARAPFLRNGTPDAAYRGEVWSRDGARRIELVSFGPTEIVVAVKGRGADTVGVNQNFDPGWTARLGGRELSVSSLDGVLGVQLPADLGEGALVVAYRAPGGRAGALVSGAALLLSLAMFFRPRRAAPTHRAVPS